MAAEAPSAPTTRAMNSLALFRALPALSGTTEAGLAGAIPPVASRAPAPGDWMVDNHKTPHRLEGLQIGAGQKSKGSGNLRLFRYDPQDHTQICGGLISKCGGGANRFCILTQCGFAHDKKVFDRLGDGAFYNVQSGGRGAASSQQPGALLEPSLPSAAAKYLADNREVLEAKQLMEGWLSLFRYLIEAEEHVGTQGSQTQA
jgi:hypothetical protein